VEALTRLLPLALALLAAAVTAVGWWVVAAVVRDTFEREYALRVDSGLKEFDESWQRKGDEIGAALGRLEGFLDGTESGGVAQRLLAGGPGAVDEAERLGALAGLDVLTIFDDRETVVSSRHWPQLAGLRERALEGLPTGRPVLRRIAGPESRRLAVIYRRLWVVGDRSIPVVGGRFVDASLAAAAGRDRAVLLFDFGEERGDPLVAAGVGAGEIRAWRNLASEVGGAEPNGYAVLESPERGTSWFAGGCELRDDRDTVLGVVVVGTTRRELDGLLSRLRVAGLAVGAVAVCLAVGSGIALSSRLSRPTDRLVRAVDAIAAGQADYTFPQGRGNELDRLAGAFSRLQRSLEQQHRRSRAAERVAAWREVARRVAHEVKNPLAPIRLTVENLIRARQQDPRQFDELFDEGARTILEEVEQLRRLVTEFSEFARLPRPQPRPADLHRLIDRALELHQAEPQLDIVREYAQGSVTVHVDPDQFGRVLKNVLGNAVESMAGGTGRRLVVRTTVEDEQIEILVEDEGSGFPAGSLAQVFEPYFTTKRGGTGLGLAIAYRIVTEHDGVIDARNRPEGGAVVLIRLPLVHEAGA
jgi:signal transduction histidine kinase